MFKIINLLFTTLIFFVVLCPGLILNIPPYEYFKNYSFPNSIIQYFNDTELNSDEYLFTNKVDVSSAVVHSVVFSLLLTLFLYLSGSFVKIWQMYEYFIMTLPLFIILTPGLFFSLPVKKYINEGLVDINLDNILFTGDVELYSSVSHGIIFISIILALEVFGFSSKILYTN